MRGAVVRVSKTNRDISRPVNKLYPIESIGKKVTIDASETTATQNRPRWEEAVIGDTGRRFVAGKC